MNARVRRASSRASGLTWVMAVAAASLLVFAVLPMALLLVRSVVGPHGLDLSPFVAAWGDGRTWSMFGTTVAMSVGTSVLTVLLGVPTAWMLARTDVPNRGALKTALALPYVIPPYILAIGWITLFNPRSGLVNGWLQAVIPSAEGPLNIYSLWGMIFVLGLAYYPLVMLQTHSALMGMDPSLEEAARTSGASPMRVVFSVTLPLVLPSIASGALLSFLVAMASFGVPYLVGNPGRVEVLTTSIYTAIDLGTEEALSRAIGLAVLLCVAAAAALGLNALLVRRGRALLGGKAGRPSLVRLGRWRWAAVAGLWGLVVVAVGVPLLTLVTTSLLTTFGRGFALDNLSLVNYATVFGDARTLSAGWTSLYLGAASATVCVAVGTLASYARKRTTLLGRRALPFLAELPYAVPGTVLAMGMILAFSQEIWVFIEDVVYVRFLMFNTAWILLVAYCVKFLAFGVRTSDAALTQVDPSLEEAARTSGATPLSVFGRIVVPLLRPALVAAWILVFLPVVGEITMSILLFGPETKTIGVLLFDYQTYESPPKAAVVGTLMVLAIVAGNLLVKRLTGGRLGL